MIQSVLLLRLKLRGELYENHSFAFIMDLGAALWAVEIDVLIRCIYFCQFMLCAIPNALLQSLSIF